jgi:hypothetical protein
MPATCSAFQKCESSIRRNASERINDGYFNGLLRRLDEVTFQMVLVCMTNLHLGDFNEFASKKSPDNIPAKDIEYEIKWRIQLVDATPLIQ